MMQALLKTFQDEVTAWEGITVAAHRFGGVEFNLGNVEIGHVHSNGMVDIPLTRKIREALVADGAAERHHILPETGWISYYIRREQDLSGAVALMKLSYLHKRRRRAATPLADELAALPFSAAVKQAATGKKPDDDEEDIAS